MMKKEYSDSISQARANAHKYNDSAVIAYIANSGYEPDAIFESASMYILPDELVTTFGLCGPYVTVAVDSNGVYAYSFEELAKVIDMYGEPFIPEAA